MADKSFSVRVVWKILASYLRSWDKRSVKSVDLFIANYKFVAARIRMFYKRKAVVVNPPVSIEKFRADKARKEFFLCVSQLVPYKKIELLVDAFNILQLPLYIIGGRDIESLKKKAKSNIQMLGKVSESILIEKMETCKAFVFAGKEDFGVVFVEALAAGAPVIAYNKGGAGEIVKNKENGLLFNTQNVESIVNCIKQFEDSNTTLLNLKQIAETAGKYRRSNFVEKIKSFFDKELKLSKKVF